MQDATKHYINGQWVISIDGREMPVENPSTEKKIATITLGGVADADAAVFVDIGVPDFCCELGLILC